MQHGVGVTQTGQAGSGLAYRHPLRSRSRHQLLCSCPRRSGSRPGFWSAAQSAPYLHHCDRYSHGWHLNMGWQDLLLRLSLVVYVPLHSRCCIT